MDLKVVLDIAKEVGLPGVVLLTLLYVFWVCIRAIVDYVKREMEFYQVWIKEQQAQRDKDQAYWQAKREEDNKRINETFDKIFACFRGLQEHQEEILRKCRCEYDEGRGGS